MTGRNPNVFYATGYAHAIGKRVILLTQEEADIPFDLKQYQHVIYGNSIVGLKDRLKTVLSAAIAVAPPGEGPTDPPVPDLSKIHGLLRDLQEQLASARTSTTQAVDNSGKQQSPNESLWLAIVEVYNRAKTIYLLAEEFDFRFQSFLQPVLELRYALEHIVRGKARRNLGSVVSQPKPTINALPWRRRLDTYTEPTLTEPTGFLCVCVNESSTL